MHSFLALTVAAIVLVYAALTLDAQRKCNSGKAPTSGEKSILNYINVSMLILSSLAVLYLGWHVFASDGHKAALARYY